MNKIWAAAIAVTMAGLVAGGPAHAGPVNFDFAGLTNNTSAPTSGNDDSGTATTGVQGYMDTQLHTAKGNSDWNVAVKGAESSGASGGTVTAAGYTGDQHVVCVGATTGSNCVPDTLSTFETTNPNKPAGTNGTPFIMTSGKTTYSSTSNNGLDTSSNGAAEISMAFTGTATDPVAVTSLSFDFEIFPDGSCPELDGTGHTTACGTNNANIPDFTFLMTTGSGTGTNVIENYTVDAVAPGTAGSTTALGNLTSSTTSATLTTYSLSNFSELGTELAPQLIGTMTFTFSSAITNPTLQFIDWPATIAVTNIDWGLPGVPTPGSLPLLATALAGLAFVRRKKLN